MTPACPEPRPAALVPHSPTHVHGPELWRSLGSSSEVDAGWGDVGRLGALGKPATVASLPSDRAGTPLGPTADRTPLRGVASWLSQCFL